MEVEIEAVQAERTEAFRREHAREALSTQWNFTTVWHEQRHEFAATFDGRVVGVLELRIAASLAHLESLIVAPDWRRRGAGRRLLERGEAAASYYNCHKVTAKVPAGLPAQAFLEACGYKLEAVLRQHTWKLDVAVMRKFLL